MDRVQFDQVSKRYVLGQRLNARESMYAAASRLLRRSSEKTGEIWSLREVSFSLPDGEALGIVGRNGAGKSTVLKILADITAPTAGVSRTRGRVAALLEVGTGFHPELTGRENVFLNGAILGMSRRDIHSRFEEIVAFSGVERFLDTPVKRYSSGMHLRLAFAVAAHLEPDILVVDEVLAVGDAEFQRRCVGRMQDAEREGRTVIFVSHDLDALSRICKRSMWLEAGRVREIGDTTTVVRDYLTSGLLPETGPALDRLEHAAGPIVVRDIRVSAADQASRVISRSDRITVEVDFAVREEVPGLDLAVLVTAGSGARLFDELMSDTTTVHFLPGDYQAQLTVPAMLNVGRYTVGLWFGTQHEDFLNEPVAAPFTVHGDDPHRSARLLALPLPLTVRRTGPNLP